MGGECSQKLRPWRGMSLLSGAQPIFSYRNIKTLPEMVQRINQEAARRPPSTPGLSRRSGRIPALPYPPIKPLHCTAVAENHQSKTIHSGGEQR